MRLSEIGCVHLNEWMVHRLPIDAFEFKPEDFEDMSKQSTQTENMMKNEEKIIISKKLADDLLWWLQNTSVPYVTWGEHITQGKTPPMEIARDSMVDELLNAIEKAEVKE